MARTITIDPITRLEGHGKIEIFLDDAGGVEDCYFQIPELRGFERFVVGRPIEELPRIVTRICGVCPASHHMAGAKAVDGCFGGQIAPLAVKLRDMYYQAHYIHSHIAHFYALAAPDFVCGPDADPSVRNILGVVAKVGLEIGGEVIRARSKAQRIQQVLGGKTTHLVWCIPGGVSKGLKKEELDEIRPLCDQLFEFAQFSLGLFKKVILENAQYVELILKGPYTLDVQNMGLVDENNAPNFYDGTVRVVDFEGRELYRYRPAEYMDFVAEHVEPWTYLKFPYLKKRGWKGFVEGIDSSIYCATPLARLNVADRMATPAAQEAFQEMFSTLGGKPCKALMAQHWARLVEMVQNAETLQKYCADPEITGDEFRVIPDRITGEGIGIVEAMRGTLTHHYTCDKKGICTSANLIVGTTNNNAPIHMVTKKAAQVRHPAGSRAHVRNPQPDRDGLPRVRPLLQLRHAQPPGPDAAGSAHPQGRRGALDLQEALSRKDAPAMKTLLLGLGNPILTDDSVGIRLATDVAARLGGRPGVDALPDCPVGGLALLDVLSGYDRVIVLDSIRTAGGVPGDWHRFTAESLRETIHLSNIHDANFATALELGRRMGRPLPSDREIHILAVEVEENATFGEALSPRLAAGLSPDSRRDLRRGPRHPGGPTGPYPSNPLHLQGRNPQLR